MGIFFLAPFIPELWIKLVFAVIWASFGVLHLYRLNEISAHEGMTEFDERWDFRVGLAIGLFSGATVVAVTGVGIDMVLYAALVLLCRADLKVAIPTSVVIMGFSSALGIAIKNLTTGLQPGVYENWLAAAPIVALGAPLGALVVNLVGRRPTLLFVAVLCVGQFIWTCSIERASLGYPGLIASRSRRSESVCLVLKDSGPGARSSSARRRRRNLREKPPRRKTRSKSHSPLRAAAKSARVPARIGSALSGFGIELHSCLHCVSTRAHSSGVRAGNSRVVFIRTNIDGRKKASLVTAAPYGRKGLWLAYPA